MAMNEVEQRGLESEERYRHLVQMLPDALVVFVDFRLMFANDSALRLFGASRLVDLHGMSVIEFVHPDSLIRLSSDVERLMNEIGPSDSQYRKLLRLDKTVIHAEIRVVAVTYDGKRGIQLLIRDISDRIRLEAAINEKEKLYESLVENTVAGVFLVQGDSLIYTNPYMAEMYGYTPGQFKSVTLNDMLDAEELDKLTNTVRAQKDQGQTLFPFKIKARRKDGSCMYLEGNSTLITVNGEESLLGMVQDVTFKHEQERQLRNNALMYQKIIKFIPEAIVLSDNGQIVYANKLALELIGYAKEEQVIGKSVSDFIHPDYHEKITKRMEEVMRSEVVSPFSEYIICNAKGTNVEVEISSIRINEYMGKRVLLSVVRDLTNRKREEEMLVRSEKLSLIGQLAAGVAHEIRNPLTALKGFTQLLKSKYSDSSHYFDIMAGEIDRINLIVNEFMTLAKPHFSKFSNGRIECILQSVLSILDTQAILFNIEIRVDLEPGLPSVYCDENQLKQVFLNIIKNAFEAMLGGGVVEITVKRISAEYICIRIHDEGPGIPEHLIAQIGEPFVTTKEKGTGLGLMISSRIIETHNGTLQIFSKKNEGTTIEITLPAPTD